MANPVYKDFMGKATEIYESSIHEITAESMDDIAERILCLAKKMLPKEMLNFKVLAPIEWQRFYKHTSRIIHNKAGQKREYLGDAIRLLYHCGSLLTNKKCGAVIIENEHQIVNRNEIKPHIEDGLRSLRGKSADIKQAEHNFFEIANHLGFKDEEIEVIP